MGKAQLRIFALAVGTFTVLLAARTTARADAFTFSFSTDPVGCSFTGNCVGTVSASGTFFTGPLSPSTGLPGASVYPVTSIVGEMNGFSMNLITPTNGAIWQPNPGQMAFGIFPFFPIQFTANGTVWNLIPDSPFPPGTDSVLFNSSGTIFNDVSLTVSPASVPEPPAIAFVGLCVISLLLVSRFKQQPN